MEKLLIEEKAKLYDEAIERAKIKRDEYIRLDGPKSHVPQDIEFIFPELVESEDEKIRKELIEFFNQFENGELRGVDITPWIAWIEKQAEQKSADKVEPKFKVDSFIVNNSRGVCQVTEIRDDEYCLYPLYGEIMGYLKIIDVDNEYHLWTIKDAKDGDVLFFNDGHGNDCIELIKSITDKKIEFWFCLTNGNHYEVFDGITPYTNFASREDAHPATQEQRELLFSKMKEAGYEWDAEKKELKKIEQKTTWGEEDEEMFDAIIADIQFTQKAHNHEVNQVVYEREIDWFKSLKDRITWKPTEKQMESIARATNRCISVDDAKALLKLYEDLKKL